MCLLQSHFLFLKRNKQTVYWFIVLWLCIKYNMCANMIFWFFYVLVHLVWSSSRKINDFVYFVVEQIWLILITILILYLPKSQRADWISESLLQYQRQSPDRYLTHPLDMKPKPNRTKQWIVRREPVLFSLLYISVIFVCPTSMIIDEKPVKMVLKDVNQHWCYLSAIHHYC